MYDFGLLLKKLREDKGLSQAQLAEKINRSRTIISKYESNLQMPTLETLVQLATIFNVSLDYLAGIDSSNAVSLEGLTDEQKNIMLTLSRYFRETRTSQSKGISKQQLEVLNQFLIELLK